MKRIVAKVGTYTKDGEEKGEYVKVGVIGEHDGREYVLIDPTVSLSGIAYKQRVNGIGKTDSDSIIASVFTDQPAQDAHNQAKSNGYQEQAEPMEFNDQIPF